jgi:DNA-binding transcriptional LysR family regulator
MTHELAACQPTVSWHAVFFIVLKRMPHSRHLPLDSHQLRTFVTLAKTGSFTQAGLDLRLTQSGVSHCIRALEEATGCRLFDRVGKMAHLTPAGEQLLHHAGRILHECAAAHAALAHRRTWGKSRLRAVVSPALPEWRLAHAVRGFHRQLPDCPVSIEVATETRALSSLLEGEADVAFGIAPYREARLTVRALGVDDLQWVVPEEHPWAQAGRVNLGDLPAQTVILPPVGDGTRRLVDEYFQREKHPVSAHVEASGVGLTLGMVREGSGIAMLADWAFRNPEARMGLRVLSPGRKRVRRTWSILLVRGREPSMATEVLARQFEESFRTL